MDLVGTLRAASHTFALAVSWAPANVRELRKGAFDGGLVEPQQNEAALFVQRVVNQLCRRRYVFLYRPICLLHNFQRERF